MHNNTSHSVPLTWLLLNSQSTVDLIANEKMLVNIRNVRANMPYTYIATETPR